ncbi:MAG TPA: OmpA family protein [Gemmatimonadaceae bacterium]|nr:OmpA family protein [Gemmatimonadaceae bacterium]
MKFWLALAVVTFGVMGCIHPRTAEQMCAYAGMETIPASSPQCVPPAPPPPPPPPPTYLMCQYPGLEGIQANDPECRVPTKMGNSKPPEPAPAYFAKNSATLAADAAKTVDKVAGFLKTSPALRVRLEGNDEDTHVPAEATRLASLRVAQVKNRLTLSGISSARIDVVSYGRERPVCGEKTEACRAKNRRVDFSFIVPGGTGYEIGELEAPTIDSLIWPPPKPSTIVTLPKRLCHDPKHPTLQGSWDLLHAAFERAGFPDDERTFSIGKADGFAMLGRMEAINDDATPKPARSRWGNPLTGDPGSFSIGQWFKEVFSRVTGRYRVIALVVTRRPMKTTNVTPSLARLDSIVDSGPIGPLPSAMGERTLAPDVPCYALIYELERPSIPANTKIVSPGTHLAREHLVKSRLWTNNQLRNP